MGTQTKQTLKEWVDTGYKFCVILGGIFGIVGTLIVLPWLKANFVTRTDYNNVIPLINNLSTNIIEIHQHIELMIEQNKVNDRQDKQLSDHETRLRAVERIGFSGGRQIDGAYRNDEK